MTTDERKDVVLGMIVSFLINVLTVIVTAWEMAGGE